MSQGSSDMEYFGKCVTLCFKNIPIPHADHLVRPMLILGLKHALHLLMLIMWYGQCWSWGCSKPYTSHVDHLVRPMLILGLQQALYFSCWSFGTANVDLGVAASITLLMLIIWYDQCWSWGCSKPYTYTKTRPTCIFTTTNNVCWRQLKI